MTQGQPNADYRQRLINALAVVISRDGYGGAKIQDVVREAKVSLRTFYAEFPNKEACFLALYEQITEALLLLLDRSVSFEGDDWRSEMEKGFRAHFAALEAAPRLTYAVLVELATLSEHARMERQAAMERLITVVRDQVDRGRERYPDVPSRSVSPMMIRAVMGGVVEMIVDLVVRDEIHRLPELVDVSTDLLWSVVTNVSEPSSPSASTPGNHPKSGVMAPSAPAEAGVRR